MLKATSIYHDNYQWLVFGRDPEKVAKIIDTNQYVIRTSERALLIDPGGIEVFSPMLTSILHHTSLQTITDIFATHQDPDIISSLGLWDKALAKARLHLPWLWEGFVHHFGSEHIEFCPIPDEGGTLDFGVTELRFIPAHYLHSSGNFHLYDPQTKILMSGDIGSALEPEGAPMYVDDFASHVTKMQLFHQRWMPSQPAKQDWIRRVRELDIRLLCPQHGRIFRGDDVQRFLDWFEELEVGIVIPS